MGSTPAYLGHSCHFFKWEVSVNIRSFEYISDMSISSLVPSENYSVSSDEWNAICTYGIEYESKDITIAGYKPFSIRADFVCVPVNSTLIRDIDHTVLCGGSYELPSSSVHEMFNDLRNKLSTIYGEPAGVGDENVLSRFFGESKYSVVWSAYTLYEYFAVWDLSNAYIVMCSKDYAESNRSYQDNVKISYIYKGTNLLVSQAREAAHREAYKQESQVYGNNDLSGL